MRQAAASRAAQRITVAGLVLNVLLTGARAVVGMSVSSPSLVADAAHSATDMVGDAITLVSVRLSRREPTPAYPYGYGRLETLASAAVSALLLSTGGGIAWHSLAQLLRGDYGSGMAELGVAALAVAVLSVVSKEAIYRMTLALGKRIHSPALIANAWHHRTDSLSSLIALVGVACHYYALPQLDSIGGALVAALITKTGVDVARRCVHEMMDGAPADRVLHRVRAAADAAVAAGSGPGDFSVADVRVRQHGPHAVVEVVLQRAPAAAPSADRDPVAQLLALCTHIRERVRATHPQAQQVSVSLREP